MNVLSPIKTETKQVPIGTQIVLDKPNTGWTVQSGRVELFFAEFHDGKPASRRHYLFEVKAGGIVMPLLIPLGTMRVMLIVSEAGVLEPLDLSAVKASAQQSQLLPKLAEQIDQWIHGMSAAAAAIVGVPPDGARALVAGDKLDAAAEAVVTARSQVVWISSQKAELAACDDTVIAARGEGAMLPGATGSATMPVAPGTWVTLRTPGQVTAYATGQALSWPHWLDVLRDFHDLTFNAIQQAIGDQQTETKKRIEARVESSERLTEHVISSFHNVATSSKKAWKGGAHEDEHLFAAFMIVAEAIGLDLTQRAREQIGKAKTVDEAIRTARLRQRQVALRGNWWREDLGPLLGFVDEERRVVALLPTGAGHWHMIDPIDGIAVKVNDSIVARIAPTAHMLYPTLPDKVLTFKDFLDFGLTRSYRDLGIAIATALAGALLGLATPIAMRLAFDRFIPGHNSLQLFELAVGLMLAALISTLFRIAYDQAALRIDGRAAGGHMAAVMDRVLRLPEAALRFGSADLALRFSSADMVRRSISNIFLSSIPAVFLTVFNGALMFYYAPPAAAVALGSFLLLCGMSAYFAWRQKDEQKKGEQLASDVFNIVFQLVQAITVLRTTASEVRAFAHWGVDFAELRARSHRARNIATVFETLLSGIDILSLAGIFLLLALLPTTNFSTGAFIAFITAYGMFSGNSMQIVRNIGAVIGLTVSWERGAVLLRAVPDRAASRRDPGRLSGKIDVTNVAFRYAGDGPMALNGLAMKAEPGEFIALVGASGSGKSTMMRLLLGLDMPLQGTIQYDGQDLRHLDSELLRRQIGVVLQNGKLFPGTLFENIMGSFHGTIDDAWDAARQAGIEEDIRALPMGMHTVVTEATAAFSGGQVQRLIIARALVSKPRILLFDEATSSLDNVTQSIVTKSLSRLAVTRIVIAHRLTTVRQADRIYVFENGRIAQTGNYDELIKTAGPFAEFARRQMI
jgi:NHLM bacteriocin system ABC transporter ATP-binding protein